MDKSFSIMLNLIRVIAALMVFFSHFSYMGYSGEALGFFHHYGHVGVIIFFVLSGYVISFVCEEKHKTFDNYMVARLARMYSVLLFALLVTYLLDNSGRYLNPEVYNGISFEYTSFKVVLNLLFLQQANIFSAKFLSNGPLWSLSYEFYYYLIFGCLIFLKGKARWVSLLILSAVAGLKILILMPCWAVGVFIRRCHQKKSKLVSSKEGYLTLIFLVLFVYLASMQNLPLHTTSFITKYLFPETNLAFSNRFLLDYALPLLFALFLYFLPLSHVLKFKTKGYIHRIVEKLSKSSFSLYLYHVPLIMFFSSLPFIDTSKIMHSIAILIASVLCIYLFSLFTEYQVHRFKNAINKIFSLVHVKDKN